jgi:hypothetical protein
MSMEYHVEYGYELPLETILLVAEDEYYDFTSYLVEKDIEIQDYAHYIVTDNTYQFDLEDNDLKSFISKSIKKYNKLLNKIRDVLKLDIILYYPQDETVYGDKREYWIVMNGIIKNPNIDLKPAKYFEVIFYS